MGEQEDMPAIGRLDTVGPGPRTNSFGHSRCRPRQCPHVVWGNGDLYGGGVKPLVRPNFDALDGLSGDSGPTRLGNER